jgi:hypothetical protein
MAENWVVLLEPGGVHLISRKATEQKIEIPVQVACLPATETDAAPEIAEPVVISVDDVCQHDGMDGIARPAEPADRTSTRRTARSPSPACACSAPRSPPPARATTATRCPSLAGACTSL